MPLYHITHPLNKPSQQFLSMPSHHTILSHHPVTHLITHSINVGMSFPKSLKAPRQSPDHTWCKCDHRQFQVGHNNNNNNNNNSISSYIDGDDTKHHCDHCVSTHAVSTQNTRTHYNTLTNLSRTDTKPSLNITQPNLIQTYHNQSYLTHSPSITQPYLTHITTHHIGSNRSPIRSFQEKSPFRCPIV